MGEQKDIKLVGCMMMKNEAYCLDRCLSSIKDIVDDIIIVDTGSTDNSVEIAKKYGAKIYHHEWQDNYSLHRNQSIKYAEELGADWIFIFDCDEEFIMDPNFDKVKYKTIKQYLGSLEEGINSCAIPLTDIQRQTTAMQFNTTRFFRKGTIEYESIVHNKPKIEGQLALYGLAKIKHYGYELDPVRQAIKEERRTRLLFKAIEENPEDWEMYFYINQDFAIRKDHANAIKYGQIYIDHREDIGKFFRKSVYYSMARSLIQSDNKEECKRIIDEGLELFPEELDLNFSSVEYGIWIMDPEYIKNGARRFIELYYKYSSDPKLTGGSFLFNLNPDSLGFCLYYLSIVLMEEGIKNIVNTINIMPAFSENFAPKLNYDIGSFLKQFKSDVDECSDEFFNKAKIDKKEIEISKDSLFQRIGRL